MILNFEKTEEIAYMEKNFSFIKSEKVFSVTSDSVRLVDFISIRKKDQVIVDIGSGIGTIPLLLTAKTTKKIIGFEVQKDIVDISINNTKLNLSNIYENYNYIAGNFLSLDSFIEDYKKEKESQSKNYAIKSENNYVIMEVKPSNGNKYTSYKKIYIDRNTGNIAKLVIQDINKKNLVYILYNKIEINS